jgi:hypothetical protein
VAKNQNQTQVRRLLVDGAYLYDVCGRLGMTPKRGTSANGYVSLLGRFADKFGIGAGETYFFGLGGVGTLFESTLTEAGYRPILVDQRDSAQARILSFEARFYHAGRNAERSCRFALPIARAVREGDVVISDTPALVAMGPQIGFVTAAYLSTATDSEKSFLAGIEPLDWSLDSFEPMVRRD